MADNALKTPLALGVDSGARVRAINMIQLLGKALPCQVTKIVSSQIVQVKFLISGGPWVLPEVTVPVATAEYVRLPVQVGDKGVAVPIDYYQGGVSGLGSGTADFTQRANLATLRFHPVGNANWSTVDNDALTMYGKNGVVLEDTAKKSVVTITPDEIIIDLTNSNNKKVTIKGTTTITFDGDLHVKGNVVAGFGGGDQVALQTHTHGNVMTGVGHTGQPDAGT